MRQTFDKEKVSFNIARLKKAGKNFEINIDPDKATEYLEKKDVAIEDILLAQSIFKDVNSGELSSENDLMEVFQTTDPITIAKEILDKGEIQLTAAYREKLRERKRNKILELIRRNAIDPKTGLPHPRMRIENAFEEAKIRINEHKSAEEQVNDIIKKLRVILPIKVGTSVIAITFPPEHASKAYSTMKKFGNFIRDEWLNDGSWLVEIEVPIGMQQDVIDKVNSLTKGEVECKIIKTN